MVWDDDTSANKQNHGKPGFWTLIQGRLPIIKIWLVSRFPCTFRHEKIGNVSNPGSLKILFIMEDLGKNTNNFRIKASLRAIKPDWLYPVQST